ncbi:hypothetical protein PoB_004148000, partial [Plakobranchus ocellatus]
MFLQDAGSLKPPKSMSKVLRHRRPKESVTQGIVGKEGCGFKDKRKFLKKGEFGENSERSLPTAIAWGSNSSIPELLAKQKSHAHTRPSSASRLAPSNRLGSSDKSKRPQSARESVTCSDKIEKVHGNLK